MKKQIKRNLVIGMICVLLSTALPSGLMKVSAWEGLVPAWSYSKGPEYEFSHEKSALEQLEDLFTTIDLQDATISSLQQEMEAGNLTSQMLTQMYLDRINAYDKEKDLNSIMWINENALEDARILDEERAAGNVRGKLHGIPIVVKDNYNVEGMPTTAGALALSDLIADEDANTVARLKTAGAVIIAKVNLSEFATSAIDSHSTMGGDAHNAYDPSRSPAGSSGGTATAVRSGFAAAGLGTDTGGSIRNPSSWSNLFGIRPTKGLTSIGGVLPLLASRDTTGPIAKTAEDVAIVLEAMAGNDDIDDYTLEADADSLLGDGYSDSLSKSLNGMRIGYLNSSFDYYTPSANVINEIAYNVLGKTDFVNPDDLPGNEALDPEMTALVRRARANLKRAGAEFVDLSGEISDEELYVYKSLNSYDGMEYEVNSFLSEYAGDSKIHTVKDIMDTGSNIGFIWDYMSDFAGVELADSFVYEDYPKYGLTQFGENRYLRPADWDKVLKYRKKISDVFETYKVDAIMYLYHESPAMVQNDNGYLLNSSGYDRAFGPVLGFPDISVPIGFATPYDKNGEKMPVGMDFVGNFGGEKNLMEIAYAYENQAGSIIRKNPELTPALRDERLNSYLDALMEEACALDPDRYGGEQSSKIRKLRDAYNKALNADYSDPQSVYDASYELAVAYDKIMDAYNKKRVAAGTVFVKGEKDKNVALSMFKGVEGINNYSSNDKKIATITKKGSFVAKKPGKTVINALYKKDKKTDAQTLSTNTITVVDKPKLKFTTTYTLNDVGKMVNANKFFVTSDYDLLDVDKWTSSKPTVAEIDNQTGIITIKGKGNAKITAYFGNIKVSATLKVKTK